MKCERYRRLIYLDREGERSAEESRELAEHLAGCSECSALAREVRRAEAVISSVRAMAPRLDRPEQLTASVMAVIGTRNDSHMTRRAGEPHGFLEVLFAPAFRAASAGFAIALLVLLAFEVGTTVVSLSGLERKMAVHTGPVVAYRIDRETVRTDPILRPLAVRIGAEHELDLNRSLVVARGMVTGFLGAGSLDLARLATTVGSDPRHLQRALKAIEARTTTVLLF